MGLILCGWCGAATAPGRCSACRHEDAERPWVQRGQQAPEVAVASPGRPALTDDEVRSRLLALGPHATDEQLADHHEVDPRTVRRWRAKVSG